MTNSNSSCLKTELSVKLKPRISRNCAGDACGNEEKEGNGLATIDLLKKPNVLSKQISRSSECALSLIKKKRSLSIELLISNFGTFDRRSTPAAPESFYPNRSSAASSSPANLSRDSPISATRTPAKAPLFRATSPSSDDEDDYAVAPSRPTGLNDSEDEEDDGEAGESSGDELAAQLMQKANLNASSPPPPVGSVPSPSRSSTKGKGKPTATPVQD